MVEINPKRITDSWTEGFALDYHTLRSEYIGDDEYGHPQFDTKRTELGELLYRLKYGKDKSVLGDIIATASQFIKSRSWLLDLIICVPPSRKGRQFQPVPPVAIGIGKTLGVDVCVEAVVKVKDTRNLRTYLILKNECVYSKKHSKFAIRLLPDVVSYYLMISIVPERHSMRFQGFCSSRAG